MLVGYSILANFAEIEVLADRALVTDANDRRNSTAITGYVGMSLKLNL
jgi:hypothetical protein